MGLLDDLKKQAEVVKSQQLDQGTLMAEKIKTVEASMKQACAYLIDLFKQLGVVRPEHPASFPVPGMGDLGGMCLADSFIDYRKKRIDDVEYFDYLSFYLKWQRPEPAKIESDMLGTIQKARDALTQHRLKFTEDSFKNARGAMAIRLTVQVERVANFTVTADPAQGRLKISANNFLRSGMDHFAVPAAEINDAWLEKFARALLGQPGEMGKYRIV